MPRRALHADFSNPAQCHLHHIKRQNCLPTAYSAEPPAKRPATVTAKTAFAMSNAAMERHIQGSETGFPIFPAVPPISGNAGPFRPGSPDSGQAPPAPEETVEWGRSRHVAPQPVDRRSQNAEHAGREDLRVAPDADVAAAKPVLQPRVDALNRGPVAVADRLRFHFPDLPGALSRRGLTSMIGTRPLCPPCRCISGAAWAASISSWKQDTRPRRSSSTAAWRPGCRAERRTPEGG